MKKTWLKSYPSNVPHTLKVDVHHSINEAFESYVKLYKHQSLLNHLGAKISYQQIEVWSRHFSAFLQQTLQLQKGDRFGVVLPNIIQFPVAVLGALRAGLIVVNCNPLYTETELQTQLENAEIKALIVLDQFAEKCKKAVSNMSIQSMIITHLSDSFTFWKRKLIMLLRGKIRTLSQKDTPNSIRYRDSLRIGANSAFKKIWIEGKDIAFLQYTGGTTGTPKGAMLTHQNILANMAQIIGIMRGGLSIKTEKVLTALPLYHIFSLTVCFFGFMSIGGTCLLITDPHDISQLIKTLNKENPTVFIGVNTLLKHLMKHADFPKLTFSQLKLTITGGMATEQSVAEAWYRKTSVVVREGYGLTEASPVVSMNPLTVQRYNGSMGLPLPNTDIMIINEHRKAVEPGAIGELCVKGPQVMKGYWHHNSETKKVIDQAGWLHTGDMVRMDQSGFLYLLDRKKDMIIVSGFNVYPTEIEAVIQSFPGIKEVAVIGVSDPTTGQAIKAIIVRSNQQINKQTILQHCHKKLTQYKIPKIIIFADLLPKGNIGKILKKKLRT